MRQVRHRGRSLVRLWPFLSLTRPLRNRGLLLLPSPNSGHFVCFRSSSSFFMVDVLPLWLLLEQLTWEGASLRALFFLGGLACCCCSCSCRRRFGLGVTAAVAVRRGDERVGFVDGNGEDKRECSPCSCVASSDSDTGSKSSGRVLKSNSSTIVVFPSFPFQQWRWGCTVNSQPGDLVCISVQQTMPARTNSMTEQ